MQPRSGFRRLLRSLRKANEDLEKCAGKVTIHDDCSECGSRIAFEFLDIPQRQIKFCNCWKCGETIRLVRTIKST